MGALDQKQFTDAFAGTKGDPNAFFVKAPDWSGVIGSLNRLAMFDMLPALDTLKQVDLNNLKLQARSQIGGGGVSLDRILSAIHTVQHREIMDFGIQDVQVNDQRAFLGCTRLDDPDGVRREINDALAKAKVAVDNGVYKYEACCGVFRYAWADILVVKRRVPGGSLVANVAAAAHYMLARYHVCAAKATQWQMKTVINEYDDKKRRAIDGGDRDLSSMAIDKGSRPFPPDFAIRKWAHQGAVDGEGDRQKCNGKASLPVIMPEIDNRYWGGIPNTKDVDKAEGAIDKAEGAK